MKIYKQKELPFILAFFLICIAIPHILMSQHEFQGMLYAPIDDCYSFFVLICVPMCSSVIAILHVRNVGSFSLILVIESVVATASYLFRLKNADILMLATSTFFVLAIESFALLGQFEKRMNGNKETSFLGEVAKDRVWLAQVFFWSIPSVYVVRILLGEGSQYTLLGILVLMLPFLFVMSKLPAWKEKNLTKGGYLGVLMIALLSVLVATDFFSNSYWFVYMILTLLGFAILLFMERWISL